MRLLRAQRVHFLLMMVVILLNNSSLRLEAQSTDRNEFNITLDINGHIIPSPPPNPYSPSSGESQNTGYGEKWYYYPNSGRYIQWYYNDPYDPERKADIDVWILIETADPDRQFILEATYCWARPEWSLRYLDRPPLPMDVPDPNIEHMFIQNRTFPIHTTNGRKHIMGRGGTVERNFSEDIDGYNPEWVGISISGVNVHVFRWLTLDCVVDESDDEDPLILGACCNPDTGSCFQSTQLGCINPNLWLGPGTTCNECQGSAAKWDFGDAPLSYPVMRAADGAHHIWQPGIHLGGQISTEADAKSTPEANGDDHDDGVQFISAFLPASVASVHVTPSVYGVINAWFDFNRDGDWYDSGEHAIINVPVGPEGNILSIDIPATAISGTTYARFRFNTAGGLNVTGQAQDGEVEDYMILIGEGGGGDPNPPSGIINPQSPLNKYMPGWSQPAQQVDPQQNLLVDSSDVSLYRTGPIVADDWDNPDHKPVIGLRWWGTFTGWTESYPPLQLPSSFHMGIWTTDVNDIMPATLIWEKYISGWTWTLNGSMMVSDPNTTGQSVFEFAKLFSQNEWLQTHPTSGSKYWISIAAVYDTNPTSEWQWMTQSTIQGNSAVHIETLIALLPGQSSQWPPIMGSVVNVVTPLEKDASFELLTVAPGATGPGGDLNGDGMVDVHDLSALMALWLNQN